MKDKKIAKIIKKLLKNKTVIMTSGIDDHFPKRRKIEISGSKKIIDKLDSVLFEEFR